MALEYVNRRGDRYFVHQRTTKTGKPTFYCSRKSDGVSVDRLPDDYELHENPENATVSVRKVRHSRVAPIERELLGRWAKNLAAIQVIVDVEGDCLVVYASDADAESSFNALSMLLERPLGNRAAHLDWITSHAHYSPMLRFALEDEDQRLYSAERWCFMGGIDDWIPLTGAAFDLETLASQLLPHVGRESFFELM